MANVWSYSGPKQWELSGYSLSVKRPNVHQRLLISHGVSTLSTRWTPAWTNQLAHVCRRSWKRKLSIPALFNASLHAVLPLTRTFLTAADFFPLGNVLSFRWTNTHFLWLPLWSRNNRHAVSLRATPIAWFAFLWGRNLTLSNSLFDYFKYQGILS